MWIPINKLKGNRAADFCAAAMTPISEIAEDDSANEIFYFSTMDEGEKPEAYTERVMRQCVPVLMRDHLNAVCQIIAANNGVDVETFRENTTPLALCADLSAIITDAEMRLFFGFVHVRGISVPAAEHPRKKRRLFGAFRQFMR